MHAAHMHKKWLSITAVSQPLILVKTMTTNISIAPPSGSWLRFQMKQPHDGLFIVIYWVICGNKHCGYSYWHSWQENVGGCISTSKQFKLAEILVHPFVCACVYRGLRVGVHMQRSHVFICRYGFMVVWIHTVYCLHLCSAPEKRLIRSPSGGSSKCYNPSCCKANWAVKLWSLLGNLLSTDSLKISPPSWFLFIQLGCQLVLVKINPFYSEHLFFIFLSWDSGQSTYL